MNEVHQLVSNMSNATISGTLQNMYEASLIGVDPLIDQWALMRSPLPMLSITAFYLLFVTKLGPWLMRNREPFKLKNVMLAYNAFQVVLCFYIVSMVTKVDNPLLWLFSFGCRYVPDRDRPLAVLVWNGTYWYMIAKLFDLLDTIFFVLRKKSNQITFLHIYHHTITFTFSWYYLKYMPAESGVFIGLINSLVHVFMYTYYGLSALGPEYRKFLWWKKYITWIQLIQFFAVVLFMFTFLTIGCTKDKFLTAFFISNAFLFIYLFGDFYRKTYIKNQQAQSAKKSEPTLQEKKVH